MPACRGRQCTRCDMVAAGSRAWQQWLGACLLWWCLVLASLEGGGVTAAADGTSASGERRAGADAGVEAGNAGTEEEDAAVFDMFADTNNVHGLVGTSDHVHYLGMQDTRDACAFPSVRFFLSRSRAAANYLAAFLHTPLTMHPAGVHCTRTRAHVEWRGLCFGRSDAFDLWNPKVQKGTFFSPPVQRPSPTTLVCPYAHAAMDGMHVRVHASSRTSAWVTWRMHDAHALACLRPPPHGLQE